MLLNKTIISLSILSCILVMLTLPRFNRNDTGLESITSNGTNTLGDAAKYIAITLYFRDEVAVDRLQPPFTYRPLVPFLAAMLPFEAMTAINLINLVAMLIAMFFMYNILAWLDLPFMLRIIGCGLLVVSFPTFYYTTIGCVDPVLISFLIIGLYLMLMNRWIYLAPVIMLGALVKETIIILALIALVHLVFKRKVLSKQGLILSLLFLCFVVGYYIARELIPVSASVIWKPSFNTLQFNISRPRSWLSFILTFGIPGILSLFILRYRTSGWFQEKLDVTTILLAGVVISISLFGYSMLSAYADGRFIWTSYPFTIPLAVIVLNEVSKKNNSFGDAIKSICLLTLPSTSTSSIRSGKGDK